MVSTREKIDTATQRRDRQHHYIDLQLVQGDNGTGTAQEKTLASTFSISDDQS